MDLLYLTITFDIFANKVCRDLNFELDINTELVVGKRPEERFLI
jgi:hypothetical protein